MSKFPIGTLKNAMDEVVADEKFAPNQPKKGITYCNMAMFTLVQKLGLNLFWNEHSDRPMLANEMVDYMDKSPCKFSKFFDPMLAYNYANDGWLVISGEKNQPHGHVAAIYPSQKLITSGKWMAQVPLVCNIGKKNEITGLNWCYENIPNFYLCL